MTIGVVVTAVGLVGLAISLAFWLADMRRPNIRGTDVAPLALGAVLLIIIGLVL